MQDKTRNWGFFRMQIGVVINQGPQNWQIIQQVNGKADIQLSGIWIGEEEADKGKVYVRVVGEETSESIVRWQKAESTGEKAWQILLRQVPVGGLYRVETCLKTEHDQPIEWARRGDMIHHIGIGDVYVIAGQSNSAGYGKDPIFDPPELGVHVLRNSCKWDLASHPLNESTGTVHPVNTEGANPGHSPYLAFAKRLKKDLGYPIGLIQTALGGSPLSAWNPLESGELYHNMVQVIRESGSTVRGILWYQGCSDTDNEQINATYLERFVGMVEHLRKDLDQSELPILTVQLNRVVSNPGLTGEELANNHKGWSRIREVQRKIPHRLPHVYVVPAIDLPLSDAIHNTSSGNLVLGERMARCALGNLYGRPVVCEAPDIKEIIQVDESKIKLIFNHVHERLYTFEVAPEEAPFRIEDEWGILRINEYGAYENTITLGVERTLGTKAYVSCGFGRAPQGQIPIDREGHLPILLFDHLPVRISSSL